jgi:AcrR family transcriptional regulator
MRSGSGGMTVQKGPGRRRAVQARSKATVQKILDSAIQLMIEKGADRVTMTEIAQRSDLVIGSLYQYFADKSAIHRAILLHHHADVRLMLHDFLTPVHSLEDLVAAGEAAFDQYFTLHQQDPLFNAIWSVVQTDAELQRLDIEDTLQNARFLQSVLLRLVPGADPDQVLAASAMLIQFSTVAGRFARAVPAPLAAHVRPVFQQMLRDGMRSIREKPLSD